MEELKGKKVLVMGGTRISCQIIEKAKELGCYVIVADYNSYEDSPGKQIADKYFDVNILDVDSVVNLISRENIKGVLVGFSDMLLPYYAEICDKANLPCYGTKQQFKLFTQKSLYKELCRKFNVPTVKEYHIDLNDYKESIHKIKYPVLVKPSDSSGSRGISICKSCEELEHCIQYAKKYSKAEEILIEQYLTGPEATVFWVFQDGEYYLTTIGNRHVKKNQGDVIPLPVGYTFPAITLNNYIGDIAPQCREMFKAAGIQNGMMFMQCKIEDGHCVVYDIGYRLTGSLEYKLLKATCGYDPLEMLIYYSVTGKMWPYSIKKMVDPFLKGKYAFNVSCLAAPGKIKEITGCESVKKMPEVCDVCIEHYPGETISEDMRGLLAQITVRVLGVVENEKYLFSTMHNIENMIDIVSTDHIRLNLPGIEQQDIAGNVYISK